MTIAAGVLIASSLEGVRESLRDRALVPEARENIRRELVDNKREFRDQVVLLRSILFVEEQMTVTARERGRKALE